MRLEGRRVVVVGGGIGGLAVALACRQRGAEVLVLEQAQAIEEVGAGIQISPNGLCVLDALGLGQGLRDRACIASAVSLRDHSGGAEVLRLDLSRLAEAGTYHFVHRADLIDLLVEGGVSSSKRQAREDIKNGAISINGERRTDLAMTLTPNDALAGMFVVVRRGKHKYFLIRWER